MDSLPGYLDPRVVGPPLFLALALGALGVLVLAALPRAQRQALLPAAPVVGVGLLVLVLHATTLLVPVAPVVPVLAVVAVGTAAWLLTGHRDRFAADRTAWAWLGGSLALGLVPMALALAPSVKADTHLAVHATGNHDAYFYVTLADWLADHPVRDQPHLAAAPGPGIDPPADTVADWALGDGLRLGESLVQAAAATALRARPVEVWTPLTATWPLLLPGAAVAMAALCGIARWPGVVAGTAAGLVGLLPLQVMNQNGPSVMATAMLPVVVGLVAAWSWGRVSTVLTAAAITAFLGTYTELAPIVGPALLVLVLTTVRPVRALPGRLATLALWSLAVGPLVWINVVRWGRLLAGAEPVWSDDSFALPATGAWSRFFGLSPVDADPVTSGWGWALLLVLTAAGLVAAAWLTPLRWVPPTVAVSTWLVWWRAEADDSLYVAERAVFLGGPVIVMFAVLGLAVAGRRAWEEVRDRDIRVPRPVLALAGVVPAAAVAAWAVSANVTTVRDTMVIHDVSDRRVRPEVEEALAQARAVTSDDGADLTVLIADFVDQLWLADGLHDRPAVVWPFLNPSYLGMTAFTDGVVDRWILVGPDAEVTAPSRAVAWSNEDFQLIDTTAGSVFVALPSLVGFHGYEPTVDGPVRWMADDGLLVVWRNDPAESAMLSAHALPTLGPVDLEFLDAAGTPLGEMVVDTVGSVGPLPLPAASTAWVIFHNVPRAELPGNGDGRFMSLELLDVWPVAGEATEEPG